MMLMGGGWEWLRPPDNTNSKVTTYRSSAQSPILIAIMNELFSGGDWLLTVTEYLETGCQRPLY